MLSGIRKLTAFYLSEDCPGYLRWNVFRAATPFEQIRKTAGRHRFRPHSWPVRFAARSVILLLWPIRTLWLVIHFNRKFGLEVSVETGKSRFRQATEQTTLALAHATPPRAYYQYGLYQSRRIGGGPEFLHNHERKSVCGLIDGYVKCEAMQDKRLFAERCNANEIPTAPVAAIVTNGQLLSADGSSESLVDESTLERLGDLFVKPQFGLRGQDAVRWKLLDDRRYQSDNGTVCTASELLATVCRQSRQQSLLIQPCLKNHPAVADLSNGALATLRVLSGRWPDGKVELIAATFKMPIGKAGTSTSGLNSPVDLNSGTLGSACRYRALDSGHQFHPDSNGKIADRVLPDWDQVVALVASPHRLFDKHAFVGWDLAFTPEGPVFLEGNIGWDTVTVQKPQESPLGAGLFTEICLAWLSQRRA